MKLKQVRKIIERSTGKERRWRKFHSGPIIKISDNEYPDLEPLMFSKDMRDFNPGPYVTEKKDCDDKALKALMHSRDKRRGPKGIGWNDDHVFMVYIADNRLQIYDPISGLDCTYEQAQQIDRKLYKIGNWDLVQIWG